MDNISMRRLRLLVALVLVSGSISAVAQAALPAGSPWVFVGFKANSQDGVYFALSQDGYHWKTVNGGKPVVKQTEPGELMRDPFLQRAPDGSFAMVWTWSWKNRTIGVSTSNDLVIWAPHRQLPVMATEPTALNTWAPALYWEAKEKRWLIFWSSTIPGRFPPNNPAEPGNNHRIWSTTTLDFKSITPPRVFFDPGFSVIDATLLPTPEIKGEPYHLIFKDERRMPLGKHLLTASGLTMEGPWTGISQPLSEDGSEGAAIIRVPGGYLAYYDHYEAPQHYGARFTADFKTWTDAAEKIDFPPGMRHGSFLQISQPEYDRLMALK